MPMYGADVDELRHFEATLRMRSQDLSRVGLELRRLLYSTEWPGADGDQFRRYYDTDLHRRLLAVAQGIDGAADRIHQNADAQEATSASAGPAVGVPLRPVSPVDTGAVARAIVRIEGALATGGLGVRDDDLDAIKATLDDLSPAEIRMVFANLSDEDLRVLKDQMQETAWKGGWSSEEQRDFLQLVLPAMTPEDVQRLMGDGWADIDDGARFSGLDDPDEVVADLFDHMRAEDGRRLPSMNERQIEVRQLDNGRFIVVLPGVVDLRTSLTDGASALLSEGSVGAAVDAVFAESEGTNKWNSARDMHYARQSEMNAENGSVDGANGYALSVKFAMRAAGVEAGDEVMLVGHSFGAYTASELATDPSFNELVSGPGGTDGFSVRVTHVAAAGAAAFRMGDLPDGTQGLLINNTADVPYQAESKLPTNPVPASAEIKFDGGHYPDALGRVNDGLGHEPTNYAAYIRGSEHPDVAAFTDSAASMYGSGGEAIRVNVLDPYRLPTN